MDNHIDAFVKLLEAMGIVYKRGRIGTYETVDVELPQRKTEEIHFVFHNGYYSHHGIQKK